MSLRTRVLPGDARRKPRSTGCLHHLPDHPMCFSRRQNGLWTAFPCRAVPAAVALLLCIHTFNPPRWMWERMRQHEPQHQRGVRAASLPVAHKNFKAGTANPRSWNAVATLELSVATGCGSTACSTPGYHAQPSSLPSLSISTTHSREAPTRGIPPCKYSRPSTRKLQGRAHPWMLRASCTNLHPLHSVFSLLPLCSKPHFPPLKFCFKPSRIAAPSPPLCSIPLLRPWGSRSYLCRGGETSSRRAPASSGQARKQRATPGASFSPPRSLLPPSPPSAGQGPRWSLAPSKPRGGAESGGGPAWIPQRWEDPEGKAGS